MSSNTQSGRKGINRAQTKNGNQQTTKAPVMIASVLAALRSLFASSVSRFFRTFIAFSVGRVDFVAVAAGLTGTLTSARLVASGPLLYGLLAVSSVTLADVGGMSIVNAVVCWTSSSWRELVGDSTAEPGAATT